MLKPRSLWTLCKSVQQNGTTPCVKKRKFHRVLSCSLSEVAEFVSTAYLSSIITVGEALHFSLCHFETRSEEGTIRLPCLHPVRVALFWSKPLLSTMALRRVWFCAVVNTAQVMPASYCYLSSFRTGMVCPRCSSVTLKMWLRTV